MVKAECISSRGEALLIVWQPVLKQTIAIYLSR